MRRHTYLGLCGAAAGMAAVAFWPSSREQTGYPFARRLAGPVASPLWRLSPDTLDLATADDIERLEQLSTQIDRALEHARANRTLLDEARVEELDSERRRRIRDIWWTFLEPVIALDQLKQRYDAWYGVDYLSHRRLHARAFAISYAALCMQVAAGQELLELVGGRKLAQTMFDEAMPDLGLPGGTFSALRARLGRARDYPGVPAGAEWYAQWMKGELDSTPLGSRLDALVSGRSTSAIKALIRGGPLRTAENKAELLKGVAFQGWFPIQQRVAEWAGDTRVAAQGRRLISDGQLAEMKRKLKPGDILVERRNWYVSNVGLPGFWPHAALYTGTRSELSGAFDGVASLKERFGRPFSEHVALRHPEVWRALGERDAAGHDHAVLEAVSEGVTVTSIEHSCGADYVAALRPRLELGEIAVALDRAFALFGRPYDFNFNFATDDAIVCSELVIKAYEPTPPGKGLRVPWVTVAGRRAVPPTELVRLFASERTQTDAQLEFVYFLDGREATKSAVVGDADGLTASVSRPKWDIAQP